jgi:hypothetical protein
MRKGFIEMGIIASVLCVAIAIASVLIFFYFFNVNVELQMREQYIWNKVQDVPMDLLSVDVDGESFVYKVNKVHYKQADETQLKNRMGEIINKQLFYFFGGATSSLTAVIRIEDIVITSSNTYIGDCKIEQRGSCEFGRKYYCSADCIDHPDEYLGCYLFPMRPSIEECLTAVIDRYSSTFPLPLVFNGTDQFIVTLSYEITELR